MLAQCFGTKMDMLNFQWICRAKKYYNLSEGDIYALIIPIQYHVTKKEIQTMAQAENMARNRARAEEKQTELKKEYARAEAEHNKLLSEKEERKRQREAAIQRLNKGRNSRAKRANPD